MTGGCRPRSQTHDRRLYVVSPLGPSEKCKLSALQDRFECFGGLECQPINPLIYANRCPSTSWTCIKDLHAFCRCEHKVSSMNTGYLWYYVSINVETSRDLFLPEIVKVFSSQRFRVSAPKSHNYTYHHQHYIFIS